VQPSRRLQFRGQPLLALPHGGFGLFAVRDVTGDLSRPDDLALGVQHRRYGERNVHSPAVLGDPHRLEMLNAITPL
jgi:hypothetical protein